MPRTNGNVRDLVVRPDPPPLPTTIHDWDAVRVGQDHRTVNDHVETIHRLLIPSEPRYKRLLHGVVDSQALEGSLSADNTLAAMMIRDRATRLDANHPLKDENYATIIKALNVVLRRYRQDRKTRRNTVGGLDIGPEQNTPQAPPAEAADAA